MVVLEEKANGATEVLAEPVAHHLISINGIDLNAAVKEFGNGRRHHIRQIGVPNTWAFVGSHLAEHGSPGLKEVLVDIGIINHMLNGDAAQQMMHVHILVVGCRYSTVEAIAIAHHGEQMKLATAQQGGNGSETGCHFRKEG